MTQRNSTARKFRFRRYEVYSLPGHKVWARRFTYYGAWDKATDLMRGRPSLVFGVRRV